MSGLRKMKSKRIKAASKVVCFAYFAYFATGKFGVMTPDGRGWRFWESRPDARGLSRRDETER